MTFLISATFLLTCFNTGMLLRIGWQVHHMHKSAAGGGA